ncbi:MAG: beta-glucosidase [Treponema sp.]|uniref:GH1 family beta-glucosidase n=1 Tax=Treponema sp. TaxID=166 RepID=UPI0025F45EF4|nr:GH1 family beta-glucosidase [Treponema sp.]MBR0495096.1 beta-glucosidase [Treponema sp.]
MGFSKDFLWGAATASYQIEGAWNEDGKVPSVWDAFCHDGSHIKNADNGDTACDHYHRYKDDVALMASFGLKAYRFSIAWSRIFTFEENEDGVLSYRENEKGIAFYNSLIDELLSHGIKPFITLYHWDLPFIIQKKGGWLNRETTKCFTDYAEAVAKHFGDRVKHFITFNEPSVFVGLGYKEGIHVPGLKLDTHDILTIGHHVHLAHGKAVRKIRELVKDTKIGITLATSPVLPENDSKEAVESARTEYFACRAEHVEWSESFWLDPIAKGSYPASLLKERADFADEIKAGDMENIKTQIDFVGLNIYQGRYARQTLRPVGVAHTDVNWNITPSALYWGTKFFFERYNLPIYITENGMACHDTVSLDGLVHDPNRIDYLHRYLLGLRNAAEEGVDIRGYFQWSLMDNFEWAEGFDPRFGMIFCDYETKKRIPKDSAHWYKRVIETNGAEL